MHAPDRIVRKSVRSEYLVTTVHGDTFRGLLVDADARTLVLANVDQITGTDGRSVSVAGEVYIPRDSVKYMQTTD